MKKIIALILILAVCAFGYLYPFWSTSGHPSDSTIASVDTFTTSWLRSTGDYEEGTLWWFITGIGDSVRFEIRYTPHYYLGFNLGLSTPWQHLYTVTTDTFSIFRLAEIAYTADSTYSGWPEHGSCQISATHYGTNDTCTIVAGLDLKNRVREAYGR